MFFIIEEQSIFSRQFPFFHQRGDLVATFLIQSHLKQRRTGAERLPGQKHLDLWLRQSVSHSLSSHHREWAFPHPVRVLLFIYNGLMASDDYDFLRETLPHLNPEKTNIDVVLFGYGRPYV